MTGGLGRYIALEFLNKNINNNERSW